MPCRRCSERPLPAHYGSPRECAFDDAGNFKTNWACETMSDLRSYLSHTVLDPVIPYGWQLRYDDYTRGLLFVPGTDHLRDTSFMPPGFQPEVPEGDFAICMCWYKSRGSVDNAFLFDRGHEPLTLEKAELALAILDAYQRQNDGR